MHAEKSLEDHACSWKEKKTMHADEKKRRPCMQMKRKEDHACRWKEKKTMHSDEKKRWQCM